LRVLLDIVNADDVLVLDGGGGAGLANEPASGRTVGGVNRRQDLDGHNAMQTGVEPFEDDAEAASADDLLHLVMRQPAEVAGLVRRRQERQVLRVCDS